MSLLSTRMTARAALIATFATTSTVLAPLATAAPDGSNIVISEVYGGGGNNGSVFANDFVELYNPTNAPINVAGWVIQQQSAAGNRGSDVTLTGTIPARSHYLVAGAAGSNATAALPTPNETSNLAFSGTNASAVLFNGPTVVDKVGWGNATNVEGAAARATTNATSVARTNPAIDTDNNAADFVVGAPTPQGTSGGTGPTHPTDPTDPTDPVEPGAITPIAQIQGTGTASPLAGQNVTTEGVVTAVYSDGGKNGIVIQTGGTGAETPAASPAIFVYLGNGGVYPTIGQSVTVAGRVAEFNGVTQLTGPTITPRAAALDPVTPLAIDYLPNGNEAREPLEHMLLQPTGAHTVTNNYQLNAFGELGLAPGDEALHQPTDVVLPGAEASALQAENDARLVTLDDGRTPNYSTTAKTVPLPYISQDGGTTIKSIRTGDAVTFQHPVVLDYSFELWRFQPTTPVTGATAGADLPITWEDSRAAELGAMAGVAGDYSIASFNVLNYFTTLGKDKNCRSYNDRNGTPVTANGCDVRGAYTESAFNDQQAKIVNAINTMDVDVLGLEEIENTATVSGDASRRDESLAALVEALNAAAGSERWAYVKSPAQVGQDEDFIRVGFIYNPNTVEPVGDSRIFNDPAFTGTARQPLAQEFRPVGGGESFVGVTNHFKSKGSVTRGDADTGDGQGNNPNVRAAQSQALIDALSEQSDWTDAPVFLLGDLNSYSREDAIRTLEANGYTNISGAHADNEPTYQFDGQLGSLDHAFGNAAAMGLIQDARVWNINADESIAFEYSRRNYNVVDFYDDSPFRSSDHDPIKVGFNLGDTPDDVETQVIAGEIEPGKDFAVTAPEGSVVTGLPDGWTSTYRDGQIIITAPADAKDGDTATVTVTSGDRVVAQGTITVTADAPVIDPEHIDADIKPGKTVAIDAPQGSVITGLPDGWTSTYRDGQIIITAPANAKNGDTATITVTSGDQVVAEGTITVTKETPGKGSSGSSWNPLRGFFDWLAKLIGGFFGRFSNS